MTPALSDYFQNQNQHCLIPPAQQHLNTHLFITNPEATSTALPSQVTMTSSIQTQHTKALHRMMGSTRLDDSAPTVAHP